ncbi:MAG TPA: ATP-binding cassette domain-containing protein [Desulfonatronum sp.]|nr:ATP-binding cassette domain-containing protein [Desulfonatronum sp.]
MNPSHTPTLSPSSGLVHAAADQRQDVPRSTTAQKQRTPGIFRHIFRSSDLRRALPGLALSSFLSNLLALALPLAILQLFDRVIVNRSSETLILLLAGVIVALSLEEVLRLLNSRVTGWLGARFEHIQTMKALERLLRAPLGLLQREEPGEHVDRLLSTAKVSGLYSGQTLLVLFDLPFVLLFLGLIWFIGGTLALVPIILLLLFILVSLSAGRWMRDQNRKRTIQDNRRHNFLNETLRGIFSVKMLGMERLMQRRYERLQQGNVDHGAELTYGSALASGLGLFFTQIMIIAIISYGGFIVFSGNMTPGGLAACMMLAVRSLQPLRRSLAIWLRYQSFVDAQQRLDTIMSLPGEKAEERPALPPVRESLVLENVTMAKSAEKNTLLFKDINLHVPAGSCIAIRGDSGSGKSSLLSLINGINRPDSGRILVDGHPLTDFDPESAAREIALLPQQGSLVSGTLMENMTLFDPSLEPAALVLSERLGLDRVVAGMKLGYDTPVSDGNAQSLPVGVAQRVAIIRALVREPSVLLFDESNIALDREGDHHLRNLLAEEKDRRTIILVTHRPSLLSLGFIRLKRTFDKNGIRRLDVSSF